LKAAKHYRIIVRLSFADSKQQTANSKQQTANSRQQTADSRRQTADGRQQTADSKQPTANSRQQARLELFAVYCLPFAVCRLLVNSFV